MKTRSKLHFLISLLMIGFVIAMIVQIVIHQRYHVTRARAASTVRSGQHMFHEKLQIDDTHVHHDDTRIADDLANKVRVLCWVMTAPSNFRTKADAVKHTWGRRCNILLFFSSEYDEHLPTVALNVSEGRSHLTAKTMQAFRYVYENYFDQADWFMKADDDTYVILENLRYFLSDKNTSMPFYYGHHFQIIVKQGYFSGGAGYVLSKEALLRFAKRDLKLCKNDGGNEDVEIGICMENLGIKTGNSTDSLGRSRFHCFTPETHLDDHYPEWYYRYDAGGAKQGIDNISDYAVSFHYVTPKHMLFLEFFVYHLRPYGIMSGDQNIN